MSKDAQKLTSAELDSALNALPQWVLEDEHLTRQFEFSDFKAAVQFINQVARLAEALNHHPDIYNSYNKVKLTLWTHFLNGLSDKDIELAERINALI